MAIVPSGRLKLMQAQTIGNPSFLGNGNSMSWNNPQSLNEEESPGEVLDIDPNADSNVVPTDTMEQIQPEEQIQPNIEENDLSHSGKKSNTIKDYIFQKLQGFGWPGRLLQEYKDNFENTSIAADGTEEVKIELVDRHYPDMSAITKEEIMKIVSEIQKSFGLHFNGASNNNGKWTIDFTSKEEQPQENGNDVGAQSYLDSVYGKQPGNHEKTKKAFTLNELIHANKDSLIKKLATIPKDIK